MWKVQLICDTCHHTQFEAADPGSRTALFRAKQQAREAGWTYVQHVGWTCSRCAARTPRILGDEAYYTGSIVTSDGVPLKGMLARIVERSTDLGTVHALFVDPSAGRYARELHWFFEYNFSSQPLEVNDGAQDASDESRETAGTAGAASACA